MAEGRKPKGRPDRKPREGPGTRSRGVIVLILSLFGLCIALYLSYFHLALLLGEVGGSRFCGPGHGLGCHAVTASDHARLLGIPVSVLGVFFYTTTAVLGLGGLIFRGGGSRPFLLWAFYLVSLGLAFDVYLGYVMFVKIQVLCPLCATSYGVNLGIFLSLLGVARRRPEASAPLRFVFPGFRTGDGPGEGPYYENVVKGFLLGFNLFAVLLFGVGSLIFARSLTANDQGVLDQIKEGLARQQPRPISVEGKPSLGPDEAEVTVVEFSDFLCPFCRLASKYIKIVAANNRDSTRFVFRHFPLDTACNPSIRRSLHPGACLLAEGAECAHEQGRFWEFHDRAFQGEGRITRRALERIASRSGLDLNRFRRCLDSNRGGRAVRRDVQEGLAAGVNSTPTLFINGRILRRIPKPRVLERLLRHSRENLPGAGTAARKTP